MCSSGGCSAGLLMPAIPHRCGHHGGLGRADLCLPPGAVQSRHEWDRGAGKSNRKSGDILRQGWSHHEDSCLTLLLPLGVCGIHQVLYYDIFRGKLSGLDMTRFNQEDFMAVCILSGCDYLSSITGMGIKTVSAAQERRREHGDQASASTPIQCLVEEPPQLLLAMTCCQVHDALPFTGGPYDAPSSLMGQSYQSSALRGHYAHTPHVRGQLPQSECSGRLVLPPTTRGCALLISLQDSPTPALSLPGSPDLPAPACL